jgi:hypothetical protein
VQEREDDAVRGDVGDCVGVDGERDGCARRRAAGLDAGGLADQLREKQGVPGAPDVEGAAVDEQSVCHRFDREAPEADHAVALVEVHAGQIAEDLGDLAGRQAAVGRELLVADGLALGEQAVDAERELLLFVARRRGGRG